MPRILILALIIFTLMPVSLAEENLDVLNGMVGDIAAKDMMRNYLDGKAAEAFAARKAELATVKSRDEADAYAAQRRVDFARQLGGFPEKTPLNVRWRGNGSGHGFRYDKVTYESRPGFLVTAVAYLPLDRKAAPYPAVLIPCGHSANGKAEAAYQRAAISLARNGIAAMIYDPFGQGERYYYYKEDGTLEFGTTLQHTVAGVGAILTGLNTATYRVWDGMRGIDYLLSRDDIDPKRIGCTGNSGGGTLTSYIMALDPRVLAAAPSCYLTNFERIFATIGPQDAEQNVFGLLAHGIDQPDYILMRAPKPTLMCVATQDFFGIDGSWDTFRQAKGFYGRYGLSEQVDLIEADDVHGFSKPRREAMVRFMTRWFFGVQKTIVEPDFDVLSEKEVLCTPTGRTIDEENSISIPELSQQRNNGFAKQRAELWKNPSKALAQVAESIALRDPVEFQNPAIERKEALQRTGYTITHLTISPEAGIVIPGVLFEPEGESKAATLYCNDQGKAADAQVGGPIEARVLAGETVLAVDLRGFGETISDRSYKSWAPYVGADWQDYYHAYLLGKTHVGMRVEDILSAVPLLSDKGALELVAHGQAVIPALHAAALANDQFAKVTLDGGPPSWTDVVNTPRAAQQLVNSVHGALLYYDLPNLAQSLGDKLSWENAAVREF
jgi:dienelactone hydrolase